ncbi:MAG: branched-chain amino acid aminotransferase [Bacteroidota bacterium]
METLEKNISVQRIAQSKLSEVDMNNIPFGKVFSDHMLVAKYKDGAWQHPEILPYGKMQLAPSLTALNYGQSVFEGMKATRNIKGEAVLFRPEENWKRMNRSAHRLCMPEIPKEIFIDGLEELIKLDSGWIPTAEQGSLYLRPLYFGSDEFIGVHPSSEYIFTVFTCPVGPFYAKPVDLLVSKDHVRAVAGGTGAAKAAGNYAGALFPDKLAKAQGYNNVLWLDAKELKYVEECGTMNMFFVVDDIVLTPQLSGTILEGITRASVIQLLKDHGYKLEVRPISIYEIQAAHHEGRLQESFGVGTAAVISHIARIGFAGEDMILPPISERKIGNWLKSHMAAIKAGEAEDTHGWMHVI